MRVSKVVTCKIYYKIHTDVKFVNACLCVSFHCFWIKIKTFSNLPFFAPLAYLNSFKINSIIKSDAVSLTLSELKMHPCVTNTNNRYPRLNFLQHRCARKKAPGNVLWEKKFNELCVMMKKKTFPVARNENFILGKFPVCRISKFIFHYCKICKKVETTLTKWKFSTGNSIKKMTKGWNCLKQISSLSFYSVDECFGWKCH